MRGAMKGYFGREMGGEGEMTTLNASWDSSAIQPPKKEEGDCGN